MTSTPYDRIAAQFDAARIGFRPKEVEYLALLLSPLEAGSTILDLGCGTGHPIATHVVSRRARPSVPSRRRGARLIETLGLTRPAG